MDWLFPAAMALTGAMGVLMGLWGLWYLLAGGFCWRKPMDYGWHPAMTRFAVLIAARNEEQVIGPLINSLLTCTTSGSSPTTAPTTPPGPPGGSGPGCWSAPSR